jgi:type III secretory pathway component EscR
MTRKKGTKKTGGREKGTPNKVTADLRSWIKELLENNTAQFEKDLKRLEPQQRTLLFEKLLQYAIPKKREEEVQEANLQSLLIKRLFRSHDDGE